MIRSLLLSFHLLVVLVPSAMAGLTILLTSEDGIDQPGLAALRKELLHKKHRVYTFAPSDDQSGMGAALSMPTVKVQPYGATEDKMWAVNGYPSSAVLVGLAMMEKEMDRVPDLVSYDSEPNGNLSPPTVTC
jgi:5'-nucleotidase